ncbi:MAG: GyrI-like domain-containing protein [Bacillota bacterium]|nr:GyrI-like domain-containing protein [Bacillota bacterium]
MNGKALDYKKEYKDLYMPDNKPVLIDIPEINFIMVDGKGDPNDNPEFQNAVEALYGLSYTIKMSKMKGLQPEGYFEYIVPPLEGLWWIEGGSFSFEERDNWKWTVMIRQPEFVNGEFYRWASSEFFRKKPALKTEKVRFEAFKEGLCVQIMHKGPFSTEPLTMSRVDEFVLKENLKSKLHTGGKHHEIYLSDYRKCNPETMKTVLRLPVEKK